MPSSRAPVAANDRRAAERTHFASAWDGTVKVLTVRETTPKARASACIAYANYAPTPTRWLAGRFPRVGPTAPEAWPKPAPSAWIPGGSPLAAPRRTATGQGTGWQDSRGDVHTSIARRTSSTRRRLSIKEVSTRRDSLGSALARLGLSPAPFGESPPRVTPAWGPPIS